VQIGGKYGARRRWGKAERTNETNVDRTVNVRGF